MAMVHRPLEPGRRGCAQVSCFNPVIPRAHLVMADNVVGIWRLNNTTQFTVGARSRIENTGGQAGLRGQMIWIALDILPISNATSGVTASIQVASHRSLVPIASVVNRPTHYCSICAILRWDLFRSRCVIFGAAQSSLMPVSASSVNPRGSSHLVLSGCNR